MSRTTRGTRTTNWSETYKHPERRNILAHGMVESSEFITKRVKRMAVARFEEEERLAKIARVIHIMGDIFAENEKELEV